MKQSRPFENLEELRRAAANDEGLPEKVRTFLSQGAALEEIFLDAFGHWFHQGERFQNTRLSELFHRSLRQTEAGTWILEVPPYVYPVQVLGCGVFVRRLSVDDHGQLLAETSGGERFPVASSRWSTDGSTEIRVSTPRGEARVVDQAYRDLTAELAALDDHWQATLLGHRIQIEPIPPTK